MAAKLTFQFVVLLITFGLFTESAFGDFVQSGPDTYVITDNDVGDTSVWEDSEKERWNSRFKPVSFEFSDMEPPVLASEFTIGEITPLSRPSIGIMFNSTSGIPGVARTLTLSSYNNETTMYTFIEANDVSADGQSGGYVQVLEGGIGYSFFVFRLKSFPGTGFQMRFRTYVEVTDATEQI